MSALDEAIAARTELHATDSWKLYGAKPTTHTALCGKHLDACIAALQATPSPVPADPLWDGTIPRGEIEFAGIGKTSPTIGERFTVAAQIDGIRPPGVATSMTRFIVKPGDQYGGSTGWRTLARQFDPAKPPTVNGVTYGTSGYDSSYALAILLPAGYPADANMWVAPIEMHQTKAPYVTVTGVAPMHLIADSSVFNLDVAGGRDGGRIIGVSQKVATGYAKGVWHVFAFRYLHHPTAGAFELWYAPAGQQMQKVVGNTGIGTMYDQTRNYPLFGIYRGQSGASTTTVYLSGLREYAKLADALAWANQLCG